MRAARNYATVLPSQFFNSELTEVSQRYPPPIPSSVYNRRMNFRYRRNPTAETVVFGIVFLGALVIGTLYLTRESEDVGTRPPASAGRWEIQDSGVENTLLDVTFVDDMHGWAIGERGVIISTTDGGNTWTRQSSGYELTLNGVEFTDESNGWVVGQLGLILNTRDGGRTWNVQGKDAALGQNLMSVHFDNVTDGRIITERGSFALRTTDGGNTWSRQFFENTLPRSDAYFHDERLGWVSFKSGAVFLTLDGGESWELLKGVNGVEIGTNSIFFLDDQNGWIGGWRGKAQGVGSGVQLVKYLTDGMVARTTDGGRTWTRHDSDTGRFLWDVVFFDSMEGWAVGSFGTVIHSRDGGVTWETRPSQTESVLRTLSFPDRNNGWAVGDEGVILRFSNEPR